MLQPEHPTEITYSQTFLVDPRFKTVDPQNTGVPRSNAIINQPHVKPRQGAGWRLASKRAAMIISIWDPILFDTMELGEINKKHDKAALACLNQYIYIYNVCQS